VSIQGHLKNSKFETQNLRTYFIYLELLIISNKKFNYKILDLVELYNFDYKLYLHPTSFEKDMNLFVPHLFLRMVDSLG